VRVTLLDTPRLVAPDTFTASDARLCVGGVPLHLLAERVGSTPFFAYDRQKLSARVASLRSALAPGIELGYAIKANPMPAVVQHLRGVVDTFDVASAHEMRIALDTGIAPLQVSFAGPGKTSAEVRQAVAAGGLIEVESEAELTRVVSIADQVGLTPRVAIRVNPDFAVKGSGMRLSGGPQQFGVDSERVPELLGRLSSCGVDFFGLYIFAASQVLSADTIF